MMREILTSSPSTQIHVPLDRQQLVSLIRKWGGTNTDGLLDPACKFFSIPHIEGIIGYRLEGKSAVVFGDPVCSPENKSALTMAFQKFSEEHNRKVVYTMLSEEFANWGAQHLSGAVIEFGETFVLDPQQDPIENSGPKAVLVRKKVKRAAKEGVVVKEYLDSDLPLEKKIEQVADQWLKGRRGAQIYLSHIQLFQDRYGKRWFYAQTGEKIVGLLLLNAIESSNGWLLNNVMITQDAPNGTSELLIVSALQTLKKEGCRFVTIGPVPVNSLKSVKGLNSFSTTVLRCVYKCANRVFRFSGHETFWKKFQPTIYGSFLLFPKNSLCFSTLKGIFKAFNVGF